MLFAATWGRTKARWHASAVLLLLAACAGPRDVVVLLPQEDGKVGKVIVSNAGGVAELDRPLSAVATRRQARPGKVFAATAADLEAEFGGALAALPPAPLHYFIYFANERTDPKPASRPVFAAAVAAAKSRSYASISIVGHADTTGPETGNVVLAERRAEKIRDRLIAKGIPRDAIDVAYRGSADPRIPSAPGVPQPLNRRVEITVR